MLRAYRKKSVQVNRNKRAEGRNKVQSSRTSGLFQLKGDRRKRRGWRLESGRRGQTQALPLTSWVAPGQLPLYASVSLHPEDGGVSDANFVTL